MVKLERRSITVATWLGAASLLCGVLHHGSRGQAQSGSSVDGATGIQQAAPPGVLDPVKTKTDLYRADANAKEELTEALARAVSEKKRVIVVFGANWCYDCHVLDRALHEGASGKVVKEAFLIVHIDIGEGEKNLDLVKKYKVPLEKGVPAVVILNGAGALLFSSAAGEFEAARRMMKRDLVKFLNHWKQTAVHRRAR